MTSHTIKGRKGMGKEDLGVPPSGSGLRPYGPEPAKQSQAEPLVPNADEPAPMPTRMQRFLAKPPKRILPETVSSRRARCVRSGRPKGWLNDLCEMQNWQCAYCRQSMSRKRRDGNPGIMATLDHMLPISRGGRNQWNNLIGACLSCNIEKGSMTADEYREFRRARFVAQAIEAQRAAAPKSDAVEDEGAGRQASPNTPTQTTGAPE
jgi:5-methylcytosine-specific restriction endonuclease McrA